MWPSKAVDGKFPLSTTASWVQGLRRHKRLISVPFDPPFALPRREPERDPAAWVIQQPGVKGAVLELVAETAERLGVRSPVTERDFEAITHDPLFLRRLEALATAVLPW
jgi:hypothetical protein